VSVRTHTNVRNFLYLCSDVPELECDFVGIDFAEGAYRVTCHLLDSEVERVAA
jgi:DNA-binding LacI/PurR family transcriptional regulator